MSNPFLYDGDEEFPDLSDGSENIYANSYRLNSQELNQPICISNAGLLVPRKLETSDLNFAIPDEDNFVSKNEFLVQTGKVTALEARTSKITDGATVSIGGNNLAINYGLQIRRENQSMGSFINWNHGQNPRWIMGMYGGASGYTGAFGLHSVVDPGAVTVPVWTVSRDNSTLVPDRFTISVPTRTTQTVFTNNQELVSKKYVDDSVAATNNRVTDLENLTSEMEFKSSEITFDVPVNVISAPTTGTQLVNKTYVDGQIFGVNAGISNISTRTSQFAFQLSPEGDFTSYKGKPLLNAGGNFELEAPLSISADVDEFKTDDLVPKRFVDESILSTIGNRNVFKRVTQFTTDYTLVFEDEFIQLGIERPIAGGSTYWRPKVIFKQLVPNSGTVDLITNVDGVWSSSTVANPTVDIPYYTYDGSDTQKSLTATVTGDLPMSFMSCEIRIVSQQTNFHCWTATISHRANNTTAGCVLLVDRF